LAYIIIAPAPIVDNSNSDGGTLRGFAKDVQRLQRLHATRHIINTTIQRDLMHETTQVIEQLCEVADHKPTPPLVAKEGCASSAMERDRLRRERQSPNTR
jgi:hypothetical protein